MKPTRSKTYPPNPIGVNATEIPMLKFADRIHSQSAAMLDASSYAWIWGNNTNGETTTASSSPLSLIGGKQWRWLVISGNGNVNLALDLYSYAWAWCQSTVGSTAGQLGTNSTIAQSSPVSVVGDRQWLRLCIGANGTSYGIDSNSYAWAWGVNSTGQLGDNSVTNRSSPVSVVGGRQFIDLVGGNTWVIALDSNSYAWAWGNNSSGYLGDNTITNRSSPVSVVGDRQWSQLPVGSTGTGTHNLLIDSLSYAWAWGNNGVGWLGDNTTTNRSSPVSVVGGRQYKRVSPAPNYTSVALDYNGVAWVWGDAASGFIAEYKVFGNQSSPVAVSAPVLFSEMRAGGTTAYCFTADGKMWAWGGNQNGQFGQSHAQLANANFSAAMACPLLKSNQFWILNSVMGK